MREKQVATAGYFLKRRITPACAGKTQTGTSLLCRIRNHTRVCGKNLGLESKPASSSGSHPHVREKRGLHGKLRLWTGITPACAGKTVEQSNPIGFYQDHPRVCGKSVRIAALETSCVGSPPRMREKLTLMVIDSHNHGITPACAGKTYRHSYR